MGPGDEYRWLLKALIGLVPVTAGIVAFAVAVRSGPSEAPREFFTASAEIIAVLFLAAALEARLFRPKSLPRLPRDSVSGWMRKLELGVRFIVLYNAVFTAAVLVVAELSALGVLMTAAKESSPTFVLGCISFALVALAATALLAASADAENHT